MSHLDNGASPSRRLPMPIKCHCGRPAKHRFVIEMFRLQEIRDVSLCHVHSAILDTVPRTSVYRVLQSSYLQRVA